MNRPLGILQDDRYRVVDEARILDALILQGWAREWQHGKHDYARREAKVVLDRWCALGLACVADASGERRFDPAEVHNFFKWSGRALGDRFYDDRQVTTGRRNVLAFHGASDVAAAAPSPAALPPVRFEVTLHRDFDLRRLDADRRILLRLPLPLESDALSDLRFDPIAPDDVDVRFSAGAGRLDARFEAPRGREAMTLGMRLSFVATPSQASGAAALGDDERELYTRQDEGLVSVTARVRELAHAVAGREADDFQRLARLRDHIFGHHRSGMIHYDELGETPVHWMLDAGWFDCQLASALLVSLCRSLGMPSRLVSGYLLYPAAPSYHYWSETWLPDRGWMPVDFITYDLSRGGVDAAWRDHFFGQLDYRMTTQRLPRWFNFTPSVRFPARWHVLTEPLGDGAAFGVFESPGGGLVYADRLSIHYADASRDRGESSVKAQPL
jgi:transglutaminase-like putative cysteine protease